MIIRKHARFVYGSHHLVFEWHEAEDGAQSYTCMNADGFEIDRFEDAKPDMTFPIWIAAVIVGTVVT